MPDWSNYLQSICTDTDYVRWWKVYTLTEVVGKEQQQQENMPLLFDFELMVQTVEREEEKRDRENKEEKERIERLGVLEGLRKYAEEHVLLVGKPGSGKSTALKRLLLEDAETGRREAEGAEGAEEAEGAEGAEGAEEAEGAEGARVERLPSSIGNKGRKIPVLVELRYYRTSILDLIQDFLQRHQPNLEVNGSILQNWLREGQLLLLVDGLNELPSPTARQDLSSFRRNYQKTTPMVFTTRDLGVGGDLDITKKLEMQPLSEKQMQQFVHKYLPQQGEQMLRQLGSRLREFGETPLLLMMLCSVFAQNDNKVPANLGSVFRQFTQIYSRKHKQDAAVSEDSRRWWKPMLEKLAWVMTCGEGKTQLQVAIPKEQGEAVLIEFLQGKVAHPENCALAWLDGLLKHHLIQLKAGELIEFPHQLLQEYYTAEYLLKLLTFSPKPLPRGYRVYTNPNPLTYTSRQSSPLNPPSLGDFDSGLPQNWGLGGKIQHSEIEQQMYVNCSSSREGGLGISDEELKREYLNYLKWTEPLALMLELVENEAQAVGVVKLALEVDWRLGARLAGAVKPKFQEQTVGLVTGLEIPQLLKILLLGITSSESILPLLIKALQDKDDSVRIMAAFALFMIGTEAAISALIIAALQDENDNVRMIAVRALDEIGTEIAIPALITALQDENDNVRIIAAGALGKIGTEAAIPALITALQDENDNVRRTAAEVLGKIRTEAAIPALITVLQDANDNVRIIAAEALGEIGTEAAIPALIPVLQDEDYSIRSNAAEALGKIGTEAVIPALITVLQDANDNVRIIAAGALGKIGTEAAIPALIPVLQDANDNVRIIAAGALGKIGTEAAIPALITALQDANDNVRMIATEVLGKIGIEAVISALITALQDEDYSIRSNAAEALGKIRTEAAIPALLPALQDENYFIRSDAAEALGETRTETVISTLIQALQDEDYDVRNNGVNALIEIGTEAVINALIKTLQNENPDVRSTVTETLGKIGTKAAINAVIESLQDEDYYVRIIAVNVLVETGTEVAIPALIQQALQDQEYSVCKNAVDALVKIGTEVVIPALIKALQDQEYPVRRDAAKALGEIGAKTAIPALIQTLQDQEYTVCRNTADALGKIGTEVAILALITALQKGQYYVRSIAADVLGKIRAKAAVYPLITALQDEEYSVRRNAAVALGEIGSEAAISALITALQDEEYSVRRNVAVALGEIDSEAAIPVLITALQDEDYYIRSIAAVALGKIRTKAAIPALIQSLQDEDYYIRSIAVDVLGKIGTKSAIPVLITALQDENYSVRSNAAVALGEIGTGAAIPALITALQDENYSVCGNAAVALGKIGTEAAIPALIQSLQDENYFVCGNAAVALGKIGTEAAIPALITALQDENYSVRSNAAEAIGEIGTEIVIHQLVKALKQEKFVSANRGDTFNFAINLLEQIQQRYQFYNPTLTQPIPTPEPQPYIPSTQLMYILHLSDLHITTPNQAILWSNQLAEDLRNELDIPHLDALILSGDIANYSTPEEYQAAEQFLHNLRQDFPLEPEQIIIVPGNHDLNWEQSEQAYHLMDRKNYQGKLQEGQYIQETDTIIRVRDEAAYKQRFINFSNFYQAIANQPYPQEYDQQGILYHLPQQNLLFLGLNSAWQLDHHYRSRASINMNALSKALTEIRRNRDYDNCLKIAVWHHPLTSAYEDRITDSAFLGQLAVAGFRFFLHGHIHEAKTSNYRYDMSQDGRNLDQICAGTFGAPTQELVTGTPWQYNLLQFEPDKLTVRTRRRTKENGAWEADSIWRQGKGTASWDYYTIQIGNGEWRMGNGEWGMENGEWRMGNGERGMENGEWRMEN